MPITEDLEILIATDQNRMAVVTPQSLPLSTKEGPGVLWIKPKAAEQLSSALRV
jgi:hypothetical protein